MSYELTSFDSQKFRFWSFISMVLLVFVHGYNLNERYLQPWSTVHEPITFTTYFELLTANALFRFRIPMLFIISGYLYALHDEKPYAQRTKKRFRTLFVPYLIWSAVGLLFTFWLETFAYGKAAVGATHILQIDEHRMLLHDYYWYEVLLRWIFAPVPFQLWFIRVLFIYNLAYPAIRWCVTTKAWYFFFPIVIFFWLMTFGMGLIEGEGLLFFSLGLCIQKFGFDISTPQKWWKPLHWMAIFLIASFTKTTLAFHLDNEVISQAILLILLHKLTIVSGLIAAWFGLNALVRSSMQQRWFIKLSAFSFIIYALHVPIITYAIDPVFTLINQWKHYRLITYIALPLLVIILCIAIGWMLRTLVPKVYRILTGERGL